MVEVSKWKSRTIGWIWICLLPSMFILGLLIGARGPVVVEVETDRLVCGVASNRFGTIRGIGCVPNIPGLFDEGIER